MLLQLLLNKLPYNQYLLLLRLHYAHNQNLECCFPSDGQWLGTHLSSAVIDKTQQHCHWFAKHPTQFQTFFNSPVYHSLSFDLQFYPVSAAFLYSCAMQLERVRVNSLVDIKCSIKLVNSVSVAVLLDSLNFFRKIIWQVYFLHYWQQFKLID